MTRFQTLLAAATAAFFALPALAHDGVHIENQYARSMGGIGASGAIFMEITNHADVDDRLIDAASDVAQKVELHTHKEDANGVMQMLHVPEGFPIAALQGHDLKRGGDHVMLMGLTRELKDGDMVHLTLTFEHAGVVEIDVPVDNARKDGMAQDMGAMNGAAKGHDMGAMNGTADAGHDMTKMGGNAHAGHNMATTPDTTGMTDPDAITAILKAQFDTPENPLTVDPIVVEGDNALASWAQGDKGGRALLARREGAWQIILCGGPDLRMPEFLTQHGVTAAETLSKLYNAAEDGLGADKVALSSSFEGVVIISE
jgi:copper(I)-binding protein